MRTALIITLILFILCLGVTFLIVTNIDTLPRYTVDSWITAIFFFEVVIVLSASILICGFIIDWTGKLRRSSHRSEKNEELLWKVALLIAFFTSIFTPYALTSRFEQYFITDKIKKEGILTTGYVTKVEMRRVSKTKRRYITYVFTTKRPYDVTYIFSVEEDKLRRGDTLTIQYLAVNPTYNSIVSSKEY